MNLEDQKSKRKSENVFIYPPKTSSKISVKNTLFQAQPNNTKKANIGAIVKIIVLSAIWIVCIVFLTMIAEYKENYRNMVIYSAEEKELIFTRNPKAIRVDVFLIGPFTKKRSPKHIDIILVSEEVSPNGNPLFDNSKGNQTTVSEYGSSVIIPTEASTAFRLKLSSEGPLELQNTMKVGHTFVAKKSQFPYGLLLNSNIDEAVGIQYEYILRADAEGLGIILGALILIGMYILIILDIVHRTFAAMIASTLALATLSAIYYRPPVNEIISWIDTETILLLFSMMILVSIMSQSGIFDYVAVFAYEKTNGKLWPLINYLILITSVISLFLDNVTTILLMTPVIIRISEVIGLDPITFLTIILMYCNITGIATPVGDPPNLMIVSNKEVIEYGVNFVNFTLHMGIGAILMMFAVYGYLRFWRLRSIEEMIDPKSSEIRELEHDIVLWTKAAQSMISQKMDDELMQETVLKKKELLDKAKDKDRIKRNVEANLVHLKERYYIKDKILLIKSVIVLAFVIGWFFFHALPFHHLDYAWSALMGCIILLILSSRQSIETCLMHVEWATLIFFAALFVLMECLTELGFIVWMGQSVAKLISMADEKNRLMVAILLVLWTSGLLSAILDNIPLTQMMIKIVIGLHFDKRLKLPLAPLLWAIAFGGGLGGNGTLIAASCNIVCAGVSEQHGYPFKFNRFFKFGFPILILTLIVTSGYLLICHVVFDWHL